MSELCFKRGMIVGLAVLLLAGCGDTTTPGGGGPDAGEDASFDAVPDGTLDALDDGGLDLVEDRALDALGDTAPDGSSDVAPDLTPDASLDTTPDGELDGALVDVVPTPTCEPACDDGDACTLDRCDLETLTCAYVPVAGCEVSTGWEGEYRTRGADREWLVGSAVVEGDSVSVRLETPAEPLDEGFNAPLVLNGTVTGDVAAGLTVPFCDAVAEASVERCLPEPPDNPGVCELSGDWVFTWCYARTECRESCDHGCRHVAEDTEASCLVEGHPAERCEVEKAVDMGICLLDFSCEAYTFCIEAAQEAEAECLAEPDANPEFCTLDLYWTLGACTLAVLSLEEVEVCDVPARGSLEAFPWGGVFVEGDPDRLVIDDAITLERVSGGGLCCHGDTCWTSDERACRESGGGFVSGSLGTCCQGADCSLRRESACELGGGEFFEGVGFCESAAGCVLTTPDACASLSGTYVANATCDGSLVFPDAPSTVLPAGRPAVCTLRGAATLGPGMQDLRMEIEGGPPLQVVANWEVVEEGVRYRAAGEVYIVVFDDGGKLVRLANVGELQVTCAPSFTLVGGASSLPELAVLDGFEGSLLSGDAPFVEFGAAFGRDLRHLADLGTSAAPINPARLYFYFAASDGLSFGVGPVSLDLGGDNAALALLDPHDPGFIMQAGGLGASTGGALDGLGVGYSEQGLLEKTLAAGLWTGRLRVDAFGTPQLQYHVDVTANGHLYYANVFTLLPFPQFDGGMVLDGNILVNLGPFAPLAQAVLASFHSESVEPLQLALGGSDPLSALSTMQVLGNLEGMYLEVGPLRLRLARGSFQLDGRGLRFRATTAASDDPDEPFFELDEGASPNLRRALDSLTPEAGIEIAGNIRSNGDFALLLNGWFEIDVETEAFEFHSEGGGTLTITNDGVTIHSGGVSDDMARALDAVGIEVNDFGWWGSEWPSF